MERREGIGEERKIEGKGEGEGKEMEGRLKRRIVGRRRK